ncbi:TetR family transcriptional regulator [Schaalia sp. 19OD2882]|uniref:TetR/AcrR family transcriptional regulator n=1 Tax=Schaalia sp. 19OD2882 TaxID=2794089 RepID=UPI001C1F1A25|nr:TetR family transcriptional regulator [Schaalia sp. 19OD2882]QWW19407.1 TetR family transcriptional regulator [Schaalia sp. 19OD2882]
MRETILTCAREQFSTLGYEATTIRSIGAAAGCDPALVTYYFGSKQQLFRACFNLPEDPTELILTRANEGLDGLARRLLEGGLDLYEQRLSRETMEALMRALITDSATTQRFRTWYREEILGQWLESLGVAEDPAVLARIEAMLGSMFGIAVMRYIVNLEPLASMSRRELIDMVEPGLQRQFDEVVALARTRAAVRQWSPPTS